MKIYNVIIEWENDKLKDETQVALLETEEESLLYDEGRFDELFDSTPYSDDDICYYANAMEGEKVEVGIDVGDFTITSVMGCEYFNDEGEWTRSDIEDMEEER